MIKKFDEKQVLFIERIKQCLQWVVDSCSGEMVEVRNGGLQYCKSHLSVKGSISQRDLDTICTVVNTTLKEIGTKVRLGNSMGEFIKYTK